MCPGYPALAGVIQYSWASLNLTCRARTACTNVFIYFTLLFTSSLEKRAPVFLFPPTLLRKFLWLKKEERITSAPRRAYWKVDTYLASAKFRNSVSVSLFTLSLSSDRTSYVLTLAYPFWSAARSYASLGNARAEFVFLFFFFDRISLEIIRYHLIFSAQRVWVIFKK